MRLYSEVTRECLFCEVICEPGQGNAKNVSVSRSSLVIGNAVGKGLLETPTILPDKGGCSCQNLSDNPLFGNVLSEVAVGPITAEKSDEGLQETLKYAFVLRKLLDYPGDKCLEYLKTSESGVGGIGEEHGWFSVCKNCLELVEKGHSIYHLIEDLIKQLLELKETLKERILESTSSSSDEEESRNNSKSDRIYTEVRRYIRLGKQRPSSVDQKPLNVKKEIDSCSSDTEGDYLNDSFGVPGIPSPANESEDDGMGKEAEPNKNVPQRHDMDLSDEDDSGAAQQKTRRKRKPRRSLRSRKTVRSRYEESGSDKDDWSQSEDEEDIPVRASGPRRNKRKYCSDSDFEETSIPNMEQESDSGSDTDNKSYAKPEFKKSENPFVSNQQREQKSMLQCGMCCAVYISKHKLRDHQKLHQLKRGVFNCEECSYVCKTEKALNMHVSKEHSSNANASMKAPKNSSSRLSGASSKDGNFPCSKCPQVYMTRGKCRAHEKLHFRDDVKRCPKCGYVCEYERAMKVHFTKYHKGSSVMEVPNIAAPEIVITRKAGNKSNSPRAKNVRQRYSDGDTSDVQSDVKEENSGLLDEPEDSTEYEYACKICSVVWKTEHRMKAHLKLHKNPSAVKCSECKFVSLTKQHLTVHENKYHPELASREDRIKRKMREKRIKQAKKNARQNEGGPFNCDHCPSVYENKHRLKEHVRRYHPDKLLQCEKCEECYESKQLMELHKTKSCNKDVNVQRKQSRVDGNQKMYICEHCSASFTTRGMYNNHVERNHSKDEHPCSECPASFRTAAQLSYHKARAHPDVHNLCTECGYKCHGAAHLRIHMQKHTKEKIAMCEICSKQFTSHSYLQSHKQMEHYEELGVEPLKCEDCDQRFPSKAVLKYHIQRVHEKNFKFFCESCGKGFLFQSALKSHALNHAKERDQICQYCGASYVHHQMLKDHMKNHHPQEFAIAYGVDPSEVPRPSVSNEGPFQCKFCEEEFTYRWTWQKHLKSHREIFDKYKCDTCGKGYSSQAGLNRHEGTAHTQTTFDCTYCGKKFPCRDYLQYHLRNNYCKKKRELDEALNSVQLAKHEDSR